ncbi:hypothetical protein EXIGLDRAFT_123628 [Exidia glandulosa HHB12029]|uniref:Uncharacterized protein n=1 Tax=Exidia glandulosa HHB12029 TaxID=1314781 RepID=A0A165NK89_EXIGL|nr:hypothetical protein EXIGLDRAFT_123628 [Exidia glandulosa HHB12029]
MVRIATTPFKAARRSTCKAPRCGSGARSRLEAAVRNGQRVTIDGLFPYVRELICVHVNNVLLMITLPRIAAVARVVETVKTKSGNFQASHRGYFESITVNIQANPTSQGCGCTKTRRIKMTSVRRMQVDWHFKPQTAKSMRSHISLFPSCESRRIVDVVRD